MSQEVALTTITLEYDRPVARGREIYGGIVDWDVVSTPGANRATWIEFSTPVTFAGTRVDAGRYGMWHIESEVARVRVSPESGDHMETLAFYFPVVGEYEAVLRLHWASTILRLRIEVPR